MAPASSTSRVSSSNTLTWRPTKIMHMRDLAKDDDFLSHLLVEKLGTGTVPLLVHKMDSSRRLPKTSTLDLMKIVRRLVASKGPLQQVVRHAVDELLLLPPIRYYLKSYTQKQVNAFATHASRYFELYHPSGSIEIAHTSRYSHRTGKSELCILATRNLTPGTVVTELKGSMANLTDEEDKELKRTDLRNSDIRRDFSVIHSKSMKKNHLFLGPARFVNHDCDNNCELFREGRYITFRVLRPIALGEEITAHYGDGYFGKKNRHCLCETCEKNGRGGYSPEHVDEGADPSSDSSSSSNSDSDSDSDSDTSSSSESEIDKENPVLNVNERRTRRGVYAISKPREEDSDDSDDDDDDDKIPLADAKDIPADGEIELTAEIDTGSDLTSLAPSLPPSDGASPANSTPGIMTPVRSPGISRSSSSLTDLSSSSNGTPKSNQSTPFRSIISTRRQKARAKEEITDETTLQDKASSTASVEPSPKRLTRSVSSLILSDKKGKVKSSQSPSSTPSSSRRPKLATKNNLSIKKEEQDSRVLRTRLPVTAAEGSKDPAPKPDIPMGRDGKPLPTCSTCLNVLPLISVDSQVVWGLSLDIGKKKANQKQECPRCIRHFAIYEQQWPSRVPPHGASSATPREEIAPVEHRHIVRIAPKVSAAYKARNFVRDEGEGRPSKKQKAIPTCIGPKVSSASYRDTTRVRDQHEVSSICMEPKVSYAAYRAITFVRDEQDEEEDRPSGSQKAVPMHIGPKVSSVAYRSVTRVRDQQEVSSMRIGPKVSYADHRAITFEQVEEEDRPSKRQKAAHELMSREMQLVGKILARRAAVTEAYWARNAPEPVKRKRGRPRLSSPRSIAKTKVKVEELQVEIPVVAQPRATNGRFGKKDKSWRKSRECSGTSSTVVKPVEDEDDVGLKTRTSPRRKRGIDAVEDSEEPPKKKSAGTQNPDTGNDIVKVEGPGQKVLPRPASGFRGGRLFSNPNPLRFALHAWAGPLILDESSSDDEKQPETPEDDLSSAADIAPAEELSPSMFLSSSILPRAPLTCKPSPFVFAKNRWNATSGAFNQVTNNRRTSTNATLSQGNLWSNLTTSHASSEEEVPRLSAADSSCLSSMPEGYPSAVWSDDEPHLSKLRHVYPVLPAAAASVMYIPKSTAFPSQSSEPTPTFINAGWDDSSDGSEV